MPFFVHATWIARPEARDLVARALRELAVHTRREPGNLAYIPCFDADQPDRFSIFELYTDNGAFQAHLESPHFRDLALQQAIPLLVDRRREYLEVLGAPDADSAEPGPENHVER